MAQSLHRQIGEYITRQPRERVAPVLDTMRIWCDGEEAYAATIGSLCVAIARIPRLSEHLALRRALDRQTRAIRDNEALCQGMLARIDPHQPMAAAVASAYVEHARNIQLMQAMLTLAGFVSLAEDSEQ
jgi:hypothetical protein